MPLTEPFLVPSALLSFTVPLTGSSVLPVLRTESVSARVLPEPTTLTAPALMLEVGAAGV